MAKKEIRRMVLAAAAVCEEKKAERIRILELSPSDSGFTDYFLICSGSNSRQNQAVADGIEEALKRDFKTYVHAVEGFRQGEWILLDYVDFVVHIFLEEKREFYDIERLRKTANPLTLEDLKKSLAEKVAGVRNRKTVTIPVTKRASAKKAPAKKTAAKKKIAKRKPDGSGRA